MLRGRAPWDSILKPPTLASHPSSGLISAEAESPTPLPWAISLCQSAPPSFLCCLLPLSPGSPELLAVSGKCHAPSLFKPPHLLSPLAWHLPTSLVSGPCSNVTVSEKPSPAPWITYRQASSSPLNLLSQRSALLNALYIYSYISPIRMSPP